LKLAPFAITPPDTASAHTRAMVQSGALIVPAAILTFGTQGGSAILCPGCFNEYDLEPIWNSDGRSANGYICTCGLAFDNSQALRLVFGHLSK
jgi:hypothetical protein